MSNELVTLEFYEVNDRGKIIGDELIMYASDVSVVPRIGDRLHLSRTEKVLGVDPDKEHRYWKVVDVEWWFESRAEEHRREFGVHRQIAIFCVRVNESIY